MMGCASIFDKEKNVKVFRVVMERKNVLPETCKRSKKIVRIDHRYAAETIKEVWADLMRNGEEHLVIKIIEEHPAITMLGKE